MSETTKTNSLPKVQKGQAQNNIAASFRRKFTSKKIMNSIVAYIVLFILIMVFVLFDFKQGINGVGYVAQVNQTQISLMDFKQEEQRIQQYYSSLFGGAMDFSGPQRTFLQQQALENLIQSELVTQAANQEGIVATDKEIRDFIVKDIPILHENGNFQRDRYARLLELNHWTPAEFEGKIRKDIAGNRSKRLFEAVSVPTALELEKLKLLNSKKWNIQFVKIDRNDFFKKYKVSESEVENQLKSPDFLKKAEAEYQATRSEYSQKEEVRAQHILVAVKDPKEDAQALEKVKKLKQRSEKEDFGKLAAAESDDPGSKTKNGDLGFFERGRMVKEFDDVAFSQAPGVVSNPIKTQFGYHLIKVLEKKDAKESSFEDVKKLVAKKLIAKEKIEGFLTNLDQAAKEKDEKKVNVILRELGISWEETGFFDLGADALPKISSPNVFKAVFDLNPENPLSNRVIHEGSDAYLLKFKESKTEQTKVDENPSDSISRRRSADNFMSWINQYRKTAKVLKNQAILKNE